MKVLYLSSLVTIKEYERMFQLYGSTSSHASQKFNRLLTRGMIQNGCQVDALSQRIILKGGESDLKRPDEDENNIHFTYLPRYKNKKINRLMTVINAYRAICRWNNDNKNGIIVCDIILGELSIAVWLASKTRKLITTAIVTDVPSIRAGENRKGLKAIPYKIKNAIIDSYNSYIFLTQQMNSVLNPNNKPYVIIEGIVDEMVTNEPNAIENKSEEKICMMAGWLEDIFGVKTLLDSFQYVRSKDARLVFYGKGGSVKTIKEYEEQDDRIRYLGELPNEQIVKREKEATLLINPRPPKEEWTAYSFPSKNMEYMASGTPLVAYDLPCIPDEYKSHMFFIPADDPSQLGGLLNELLSMPAQKLHDFGLSAQKWIVEEKNPGNQVKRLVTMFRNELLHTN